MAADSTTTTSRDSPDANNNSRSSSDRIDINSCGSGFIVIILYRLFTVFIHLFTYLFVYCCFVDIPALLVTAAGVGMLIVAVVVVAFHVIIGINSRAVVAAAAACVSVVNTGVGEVRRADVA